jgi:hypothetical protein
MRRLSCVCAVLCLAASAYAGVGKISGIVVDENGSPMPSMIVEASPVGMAWSGGTPQCKTDASGRFEIALLLGKWDLYPRSDADLYPDLSSSFFNTETSRGKLVELTPQNPEALIELKLAPKAGAIVGHATDADDGTTLHPQFDLSWASGEPTKRMGIRTGDPYRILLPADT